MVNAACYWNIMSHIANPSPNTRLIGPMLIWLVVITAGAAVAIFATGAVDSVGKVAVSLAIPALLSLLLLPALHQTWSQVVQPLLQSFACL